MKSPLFLILVLLSVGPIRSQNYNKDIKLGEEASKQVVQQMGIYKHDSLQKLVEAVGNRLVNQLNNKPFPFRFYLADSEEPNAFALPGGYVYVTRGILPLLQNEDELACIMAHEIMHCIRRHSVKQMNRRIVPAILKIPGNIINAITFSHLGNILNTPIDFISGGFQAKYSRKHEKEADELGIQLAAKAGYHSLPLAQVLQRLSKEVEFITGEKERRRYFNDHPITEDRVEYIAKTGPKLSVAQASDYTASDESFRSYLNGLCFGPNPDQGAFEAGDFIHPGLEFAFSVPNAWMKENSPEMVAAADSSKEAMVALSLLEPGKTPQELINSYQKKLAKSSNAKLEASGDTLINGLKTQMLRIRQSEKGKTIVLEIFWIHKDKVYYQFIGLSTAAKRKATAEALRSFHQSKAEEIARLNVHTVRLFAARPNEKPEELMQRSKNILKPELTLLFNDLKKDSSLQEKQAIKVVLKERYKP